jgi:hypothetical protein
VVFLLPPLTISSESRASVLDCRSVMPWTSRGTAHGKSSPGIMARSRVAYHIYRSLMKG